MKLRELLVGRRGESPLVPPNIQKGNCTAILVA